MTLTEVLQKHNSIVMKVIKYTPVNNLGVLGYEAVCAIWDGTKFVRHDLRISCIQKQKFDRSIVLGQAYEIQSSGCLLFTYRAHPHCASWPKANLSAGVAATPSPIPTPSKRHKLVIEV